VESLRGVADGTLVLRPPNDPVPGLTEEPHF
jgi:hypothetical protein